VQLRTVKGLRSVKTASDWTDSMQVSEDNLGYGTVEGSCEHGSEVRVQ
jgi:hypothetical protein